MSPVPREGTCVVSSRHEAGEGCDNGWKSTRADVRAPGAVRNPLFCPAVRPGGGTQRVWGLEGVLGVDGEERGREAP